MDEHMGNMFHHRVHENLKRRAGVACHPDYETDGRRLQKQQDHHTLQKYIGKQPVGSLLPCLPVFLQRELIWRTNLRRQNGSLLPEPNLSRARCIKSVCQKIKIEKDSNLIPVLWQIICEPGRNIHWDHFIQQMRKKKHERAKGLPRFGFQMTSHVSSSRSASHSSVKRSRTPLAAPVQRSATLSFQTTSGIRAFRVLDSSVPITQEPASPIHY